MKDSKKKDDVSGNSTDLDAYSKQRLLQTLKQYRCIQGKRVKIERLISTVYDNRSERPSDGTLRSIVQWINGNKKDYHPTRKSIQELCIWAGIAKENIKPIKRCTVAPIHGGFFNEEINPFKESLCQRTKLRGLIFSDIYASSYLMETFSNLQKIDTLNSLVPNFEYLKQILLLPIEELDKSASLCRKNIKELKKFENFFLRDQNSSGCLLDIRCCDKLNVDWVGVFITDKKISKDNNHLFRPFFATGSENDYRYFSYPNESELAKQLRDQTVEQFNMASNSKWEELKSLM